MATNKTAKKTTTQSSAKRTTKKTRIRRTDEQIIADLQDRIRQVKRRAEAKRLKESPAVRSALSAVKAIDRGLEAAAEESDTHLRHALADARKPLAEHLTEAGVRLPKARLPRGRRPSK